MPNQQISVKEQLEKKFMSKYKKGEKYGKKCFIVDKYGVEAFYIGEYHDKAMSCYVNIEYALEGENGFFEGGGMYIVDSYKDLDALFMDLVEEIES